MLIRWKLFGIPYKPAVLQSQPQQVMLHQEPATLLSVATATNAFQQTQQAPLQEELTFLSLQPYTIQPESASPGSTTSASITQAGVRLSTTAASAAPSGAHTTIL